VSATKTWSARAAGEIVPPGDGWIQFPGPFGPGWPRLESVPADPRV